MIRRLTKLPYYFFTLTAIILAAIIFVLCYSKPQAFLMLNGFHTVILDLFFKYATNLGDGILSIAIAAVLLLSGKRKKSITLLLSYAYSGLIVQIAKRIFDMPRPRYFFEQISVKYDHYVQGVQMHDHNSFPSGHTASAFAIATAMVLVYKKKKISLGFLFAAVIVGYSRIYLAQHFLLDVIVGALAGTVCALVSYHQVYDLKLFRSAKATKRLKQMKTVNTQTSPI